MKFLQLVVLLLMMVVLAGCPGGGTTADNKGGSGGSGGNPTPTPTPSPTPTPTPTPAPSPSISSFTPMYAAPGATVTLTGSNFSAAGLSIQVINGSTNPPCATSTYVSATEVQCVVPAGLTNLSENPFRVTTTIGGASANSASNFMVRAIPTTVSTIAYGAGANYNNYCAILSDGSVDCWGGSANVQNKPTDSNWTHGPVVIPDAATGNYVLTGVSQVTVSNTFACALLTNNTVYCWGMSKPDASANLQITQVMNGASPWSVTQIAAGEDFMCGIITGGSVECLGNNQHAQFGNATETNSTTPTPADSPLNGSPVITKVTASGESACFNTATGATFCTGIDYETSSSGTIPTGTAGPETAYDFPNIYAATSIALGSGMDCITSYDGSPLTNLTCWGYLWSTTPTAASSLSGSGILYSWNGTGPYMTQVSISSNGGETICELYSNGNVSCEGYMPALNESITPVITSNNMSFLAGTCGITTSHTVSCWGDNYGEGVSTGAPVEAYSLTPVSPGNGIWQ
jgi:IPT/TIG domain